MRVLLTAFEPFDDSGLNASLEGCRAFLERWPGEFDVRFAVLPVVYGLDVSATDAALSHGPVDVILHTGQHGGARSIHVERLAVNVRYASEDLRGDPIPQRLIEPEGPAAVFARLPVERLAEAIRAEGVPAEVSNHGGVYLCNHVLYQSVRREQRANSAVGVGFLHVPRLPEQAAPGEPSMTAAQNALAIHAALRSLAG